MERINWRDETLTLRDGIKLKARLWIPVIGGNKWPALLMRQPYGREIASTITYLHPTWWANQGYLVVIQDVRGQGGSDGSFKGFEQEASDTSQTHSWVRSLPECNGRLGTYGFSYQGLTQLVAEPGSQPPECLAPAMTGLDEFNHWSCDGGAFWWHLGLAWGLQLAALRAKRKGNWTAWRKIRQSLEDGSYLRNGPLLLKENDPQGMALNWLKRSGESNQKWNVHKPLKSWLRQPMLLIGGWWDPHLTGILDIYNQSVQAGGLPEIHIGPATHLQWWEETQSILLDFFNRHLQSNEPLNKTYPKQMFWNLTSKQWQSSSKLTNPNLNWSLISKGMACIDSNEGILRQDANGDGHVTIVSDPWRPVPSIGGHLSPQPGEADRGDLDMRADVALFNSPALDKELHLEGIPNLTFKADADSESFDICVALSIVNHDQTKVSQISTGTLRVLGIKAKATLTKKIILQPVLANIKEGERLRLSISGSAWPAIGVNPGHPKKSCGAPEPDCNVITMYLELADSNFNVLPLLSHKPLQESLTSD